MNCIGGTTWSSVKATMRPLLEARKINLLVQWGTAADPEISGYAKRNVPLIQDYGQTDLDRRVLVFIGAGAAFGRPILAPPGIPPERVAILRQAFDRTMADPAFLAEAAKLNMDIKPLGGAEMQKIAIEIVQVAGERSGARERADRRDDIRRARPACGPTPARRYTS